MVKTVMENLPDETIEHIGKYLDTDSLYGLYMIYPADHPCHKILLDLKKYPARKIVGKKYRGIWKYENISASVYA